MQTKSLNQTSSPAPPAAAAASSPTPKSREPATESGTDEDPSTTQGNSLKPKTHYARYDPTKEEELLPAISDLISGDLSEPYSIYVYRYFLYEWGRFCYMAFNDRDQLIGAVICKLEQHRGGPLRGYIAMLAVQKEYRGHGIATQLVKYAIDAMAAEDADEIALETEVSNQPSLRLYASLGFLRSKRLHRYYLNGNEAFRLILYLKDGVADMRTHAPEYPPEQQPAELEGSIPSYNHVDDYA